MTTGPTDLTWPALLAHWTGVAQASLALPKTAEGDRWRAAIPSIIGLQAITFALGDLDALSRDLPGERALGIDKAELLTRQHAGELYALWRSEPLPEDLASMIADARLATSAARGAGVEWRITSDRLIADHPGEILSILVSSGFTGDLYLPVPGAALFLGSPAAFAKGPAGERPSDLVIRAVKEFLVDVTKPERVPGMRQVYRQFDFGTGKVRRDLVAPLDRTRASSGTDEILIPGQPQLIPVIQRGVALPVNWPIPGMGLIESVPVEFSNGE